MDHRLVLSAGQGLPQVLRKQPLGSRAMPCIISCERAAEQASKQTVLQVVV
jgi:hypothetical protein